MDCGKVRVLSVDDDSADRMALRRCLKRSGVDVELTEADCLAAAMAMDAAAPPDLIMLDYLLPDADEFSALAALGERFPDAAIVMVTGQGDERVASGAIKGGASDYIPKPDVNERSITRVVSRAVEKNRLRLELEARQRDLTSFARVLAHDLRAPMRTLRNFTASFEANIRKGAADEAAEDAEAIAASVNRMSALIDSLSRYARADISTAMEPVSMASVIETAKANLRMEIEETGAEVTHGALPDATGDEALLVQLFQNLIENAMKYRSDAPPRIHISGAPNDAGLLTFAVEDNGIGVPEESRASILKPFTRLHGAYDIPGSGLGLATCKRITDRHGGDIRVEGADGGGARFVITLPEAVKAADAA